MSPTKQKPLKPTDVPEEVIQMLAESMRIDAATALDLLMALQRDVIRGARGESAAISSKD